MSALDVLGAIGSVVSIGSGVVAVLQARKATKAREAAEAARNELRQRQADLALGSMHTKGQHVVDLTRLLADRSPQVRRGLSVGSVVQEIQKYVDELGEHAHDVPTAARSDFEELHRRLREAVQLVRPRGGNADRADECRLHDLMARMLSMLRRLLDGAR